MQKIVSNLLAFSRSHDPSEAGRVERPPRRDDHRARRLQFKVNNIRVETDFDPDLPMTLGDFLPDRTGLRVNLITNALQAMADSHVGGALFSKTRQAAENGENWLRVNVKDDGPGIHRTTWRGSSIRSSRQSRRGGDRPQPGPGPADHPGAPGRIRVSSEPMKGRRSRSIFPSGPRFLRRATRLNEPASEGGSQGGQHARKKAIPGRRRRAVDPLAPVRHARGKRIRRRDGPEQKRRPQEAEDALLRPDLTDVKMPGLSGIELYDRVGRSSPASSPGSSSCRGHRHGATRLPGRSPRSMPSQAVRSGRRLRPRCAIPRSEGSGRMQPDPWRGSSPSPARPDSQQVGAYRIARWRKTNGPCGSGSGAGLMGRCGSWNGLLSGASVRRSCLRAPGRSSSWVSRTSPRDFPRPRKPRARVSRFASGKDYHEDHRRPTGRHGLQRGGSGSGKDASFRSYVDTGPVAEKAWAREAGLGGDPGRTRSSSFPVSVSYFFSP